MGKKNKNKQKGKGTEKTALKTKKNIEAKQKKILSKIGEANIEDIINKLEAEEGRLNEIKEIVCSPPTPRSNFSICVHPEKDEIILFGGELYDGQKVHVYNDLFFYSIEKNEWKLVKSPAGPTPRSGHQMVSIASEGGQLWLFGGEHASPSQLQFYHYKDLWVLQITTKKWEKINSPNGPSPRSGHRMLAMKKKLIIFGGFYDNNHSYQYYNDLHIFSLESYSWLQIEVSGVIHPPPRSGCCVAGTQDGKILIWGGYSKSPVKKDFDKGVTHTDMYALVPDKSQSNTKFKWTTVKPGGIRPAPRSGTSFALSPNNKVYCFGGVMDTQEDEESLQGQFGNELYCLDLSTISWRLLEVNKKSRIVKKKTESMDVEEDVSKTNVTTDGVFTLTVKGASKSADATQSKVLENLPTPRMNAGVAICKGVLYLYGGIFEEDKKQCTLSDLYSLDLHKLNEWKTLIPNNLGAHEWFDSDSEESNSSESGGSLSSDNSDSSDSSEMETD